MTRDDIIDMANKAHAYIDRRFMVASSTGIASFEHFARLVAEREREECAKVCDEMEQKAEGTECCKWPTPADCAHTIRARGQS
jgi:hypothetical protein